MILARLNDAEHTRYYIDPKTARVVGSACHRHAAAAIELVVCGGGARNADLMRRLADTLAPMPVVASGTKGVPEDQVEAAAFAWLARAFLTRAPGNWLPRR